MATTESLRDYLKALYLQVNPKNKGKDFEKLLDFAIMNGINDFVGALPWAFREKNDTVTTTVSSSTVELPDDFDAIISITEHTTANGRKLIRYSSDEFDRLVPYSEDMNADTPQIYKIYFDYNSGVWKLGLYPTPDAAISLYVSYLSLPKDAPDKYIGGVIAAIGKYMYSPGSEGRMAAIAQYNAEIERIRRVDNVDASPITRVQDSGDEPLEFNWDEYLRVRAG